ncbi:hypothetical protein RLOC_00013792 [Lonchura striata]|uniref:dUTPase-like domain-containing protein n=1 Tax=Lonchura striata TaxID=40157 RepID=A0A218UNU6_9PASE|nr:hypothetical protein RLOC_00013792 [Lonchura striata domestica]
MEHEESQRKDPNGDSHVECPKQLQPASSLQPSTSGRLGLDLATTIDITLIDMKPVKIPTGIKEPMMHKDKSCGAPLLGHSSAGLRGLFVLRGIIDDDFTSKILIVAMTFYPPLIIPAGSKITQLVPTLQLTEAASSVMQCSVDDLLIAAPTLTEMEQSRASAVTEIQNTGLEISITKIQEISITKIQEVPPWKYLR